MISIRVFKAENNKANKSYYAVTGAKTEAEAINEVIKYKKASKIPSSILIAEKAISHPTRTDSMAYGSDYLSAGHRAAT